MKVQCRMHGPRTVVVAGERPSGPSFAGRSPVDKLRSARPPFHGGAVAPAAAPVGPRAPNSAATGGPAAAGAAPVLCDGSAPGAALVLTAAFAVTGAADASASLHGDDAASDSVDGIADATGPADAAGTVATGFDRLDAELAGGGWPCRALTELLLPPSGAGELRLLAPALRAALRAGRTVMLFDPPAGLTARSLARLGLDAEHLLVIESRSRLLADAGSLWALEQALKSGHVGAVVAWLPPRLAAERLRRLQLAAQRHDGPAFVLREAAAAARPTAAPLRLALHPQGDDGLTLRLLKRRLPASAGLLRLKLPPLRAVPAAMGVAAPALTPTSLPPAAATTTVARAAPAAVPSQASLFAPGRWAAPATDGERGAPSEAAPTVGAHSADARVAASGRSSGAMHSTDRLHSAVFVDLAA